MDVLDLDLDWSRTSRPPSLEILFPTIFIIIIIKTVNFKKWYFFAVDSSFMCSKWVLIGCENNWTILKDHHVNVCCVVLLWNDSKILEGFLESVEHCQMRFHVTIGHRIVGAFPSFALWLFSNVSLQKIEKWLDNNNYYNVIIKRC